jgi:hypothetical protein
VSATDIHPGHRRRDSHTVSAGADLDHGQPVPATHPTTAVVDCPPGHSAIDAHASNARGTNLGTDHARYDAQTLVVGASILPPAKPATTPILASPAATLSDPGHSTFDAQVDVAGADLAFACASLSDIESARIAMGNRLGAVQREAEAAESVEILDSPEYKRAKLIFDALEHVEKLAELEVKRGVRRHPLGEWIKATIGIGEKQGARMITAIGDPTWNDAEDRPRRGPAELWQYSGHGDPARSRRRRGQRVEFSPEVKMRVHLCAMSCIKQAHSPYRIVYDEARAAWADRDTTDGHKHNHALRLVGKAILLDLWKFSRGEAA